MRQKYSVVIADTSCFILLDKINEMEILHKVFGRIETPSVIAQEFGKPLPPWININDTSDSRYMDILELEIDRGEASAFALAVTKDDPLLILDDFYARRLADRLKMNYTGTLGVLLKAKQENIIPAIRPILDKLQQTN